IFFVEQPLQTWNFSKDWRFTKRIRYLLLDDPAQNQRLSILGFEIGLEVTGVNNGSAKQRLSGNNRGRFRVDFQRYIPIDVDMRRDFENHTHRFVREALV